MVRERLGTDIGQLVLKAVIRMKPRTIIGSVIILVLIISLAVGAFVLLKQKDVHVVNEHGEIEEVKDTVNDKTEDLINEPASENKDEVIEKLIREGFVFSTTRTKEEVMENVGEPLRIENEEYENRHNDDIDNIATLYYDGFEISFYEVASDDRQIMLDWEITNEDYQMIYGLKVGVTEQFVFELLGEPTYLNGDYKVFEHFEDYGCLAFKVQDGLVVEIAGRVYLD